MTDDNTLPDECICMECGETSRAVWMDYGIGRYEYAGRYCTDVDFQAVSECCEADYIAIA